MKSSKKQSKSSTFKPILTLAIICLIIVTAYVGFVGFETYLSSQEAKTITANDVKSAPPIESTADLDEAEQILDQTNPSGSNNDDAKQLNQELSGF